ncbi:hypothetical protein PINS_up004201 [Pythium insidiosum]|nr:hypothetical protein PINS_up004201 [Pythium insidiosum]
MSSVNPRATSFCPSVPTVTIDCDNDQGIAFDICVVRPRADNPSKCEIDRDCVRSDMTWFTFSCPRKNIAAVANLPSLLEALHLEENDIESFKPAFPQGSSVLTDVCLSGNKITRMENVHVPSSTTALTLRSNSVERIRFHPGLPNVETIDLGENPIESIEDVSLPPSLSSLYLDGANITAAIFHSGLRNLHYLMLHNNPISSFEVRTQSLALKQIIITAPSLADVKLPDSVRNAEIFVRDMQGRDDYAALANLEELVHRAHFLLILVHLVKTFIR